MKEIFNIAARLTISFMLAGVIMGAVFVMTEGPKKHNAHVNEQKVMLGLLGFSEDNPAPESIKLFNLYRYVLQQGDNKFLGYVLPIKDKEEHQLVVIDLEGQYVAQYPLQISMSEVDDLDLRNQIVAGAISSEYEFQFADKSIFVNDAGERSAYLLPGKSSGFKTFIHMIMALDPQLTVMGFEVLEHEEDPGLGDGIEKDYFKNQFRDKTVEVMKSIKVVKMPLPQEYRKYLENDPDLDEAERVRIREEHLKDDIYALTGATISSDAVNNGLKIMLKKFAYRIKVLEKVISEQSIPVAF